MVIFTKKFKLFHYPISGDIVDYSDNTDAEIVDSIFSDWGDYQVQGMVNVSDMTVDQARDKLIENDINPNIYTTACSIRTFAGNINDEVVDDEMEDSFFPELSFCTADYEINCYCCTDQRLCFVIDVNGVFCRLMYTDDMMDMQELEGNGAYYLTPVANWIEKIVKDTALAV